MNGSGCGGCGGGGEWREGADRWVFQQPERPPIKQFPSLTPSLMTLSKNQKYRSLNCSAKTSVKLDPCDLTGHSCETP